MKGNLLTREVVPHVLAFLGLVLATLLLDGVLHLLGLLWVGRYLGIPGTLLILGSFGYSLRKRKLIAAGKPAVLLRWHERLTWIGSLMVLVHAGVHFNGALAWLAVLAMLGTVASGLAGKVLLERTRRGLAEARRQLREEGVAAEVVEDRLYWDSVTVDLMKQWRVVHFPITFTFAVLALTHIAAVAVFGGGP